MGRLFRAYSLQETRHIRYRSTSMFSKVLQSITGMDDLERVAAKEDLAALNAYLKTRHVFVPIRPRRFLDVDCSQEQLLELMETGAKEMAGNEFESHLLRIGNENSAY